MKDIPERLWHDSYVRVGKKKTGGPNLRLLRLDPNYPSNTVTAYIFNKFAHPFEDRYITPREAARLQQFPDEHEFAGPITSVQLQIGNAVPVGLAEAVAQHVHSRLDASSTKKSYSAVSLFSGAGGMDLGFRKWFSVVSANEVVPHFAETLRLNFPETNVLEEDVSNIKGSDLAPAGEIDVVFGGPPCQPFSAAGKQRGVEDPRGRLVREYLRLVSELAPKYFVLENVPGLVSNSNGGAIKFILDGAAACGYEVEYFVLLAADYGTPQLRRRLFVIGRSSNAEPPLGIPIPQRALSAPSQESLFLPPYATVGEAFSGLGGALPR